ncbi:MAG: hypothetical protein LBL00_04305 [Endomicrobium sp.]|nr:hypothetical protein [Endomicrobium sp.]
MKKIFLLLTVCLISCGIFLLSCSKKDEKKKNPVITIEPSTITLLVNGLQYSGEMLSVYSDQQVKFEAILSDENGQRVENYTTTWTLSDRGIGFFTSITGDPTTANPVWLSTLSDYSGTGAYIQVDCTEQGKTTPISKRIKLEFISFSVRQDSKSMDRVVSTETPEIRVYEIVSSNPEIVDKDNVRISWSAHDVDNPNSTDEIGYFLPPITKIGEYTTYYHDHGDDYEGDIGMIATIISGVSDEYIELRSELIIIGFRQKDIWD